MTSPARRLWRAYQRHGVAGTGRRVLRVGRRIVAGRLRTTTAGGTPLTGAASDVAVTLLGVTWEGSELVLRARVDGPPSAPGAHPSRRPGNDPVAVVVGMTPHPVDWSDDGSFRARVRVPREAGRFPVNVRAGIAAQGLVTPFTGCELSGGPRTLTSRAIGWTSVRPVWQAGVGFRLDVTTFEVRVEGAHARTPGRFELRLRRRSGVAAVSRVALSSRGTTLLLPTTGTRGTVGLGSNDLATVAATLGGPTPDQPRPTELVLRSFGRRLPLLWAVERAVSTGGVRLRALPSGTATAERIVAELLVRHVQLGAHAVHLVATFTPGAETDRATPYRVRLVGPRQEWSAEIEPGPDGGVELDLPLQIAAPWTPRPVWLLPGSYAVELVRGEQRWPVRVPPWQLAEFARSAAPRTTPSGLAVRPHLVAGGALTFVLSVRLPTGEFTPADQDRLRVAYRRSTRSVRPELALFTSFGGRNGHDNTRAIEQELRRRRPELQSRWTLSHPGIEVPDGARGLLSGSRAWWQTLAQARWVVTNSWLPRGFVARPGQVVLQAWHGTPYKHLGLDRRVVPADAERAQAITRHAGLWDLMIAQNPYSVEIFRRAYGFSGELPVTGYPRNDALVRGVPPERLRELRLQLGVGTKQIVLYAPTFRTVDGVISWFAELDLARLAAAVGPDSAVLVRGHVNVVRLAGTVGTDAVVDVSLFPDITELFALADVLVTDYSSSMFDFAVTGRPIVYFVPDLADYGTARGAYFDLAAQAPGPLTTTTDEAVEAVRSALDGTSTAAYATRYARWRSTYLPREDGQAARRVVDALLTHEPH